MNALPVPDAWAYADVPARHARRDEFTAAEQLTGVELVRDDLFDSRLPAASFDLVHARFQITPLGWADEQLDAYLRLVRPGGYVVIEVPDSAPWHYNPHAPALAELIGLIVEAFHRGGGDFDAGRHTAGLLRARGLRPEVRAEIVTLPPGHPYLRLPLQFASSLRPRLLPLAGQENLDQLAARAEAELAEPGRWATTFTLIQTWAVA